MTIGLDMGIVVLHNWTQLGDFLLEVTPEETAGENPGKSFDFSFL